MNIVLVTYTFCTPSVVGGAFFRALRLAVEFHRRGWRPMLCNRGPILDDPKVHQAQPLVQLVDLDTLGPAPDAEAARRLLGSLEPSVIVFGERPLDSLRVLYDGARMVGRPFVVLDQYYSDWLVEEPPHGVDLMLLYGLRSFWGGCPALPPRCAMVPPFIEQVALETDLPVPARLRGLPWVSLVAYDAGVLERGLELLSTVADLPVAFVVVSRDPRFAAQRALQLGLRAASTVALPLQDDATMFGLLGASSVAVISNGFLQIMESLAMACPVLCIDRGVGLWAWLVDDRFKGVVSIGQSLSEQSQRLRKWVAHPPIDAELRDALQTERNGCRLSAELIEQVVAHVA